MQTYYWIQTKNEYGLKQNNNKEDTTKIKINKIDERSDRAAAEKDETPCGQL